MSNATHAAALPHHAGQVSRWITLLLAAACGMIVANLYYAQPLVGPISRALDLSPQAAGIIVTLVQIGYGMGLLLLVPLADIVENRRLVVTLLLANTLALTLAALATHAAIFLLAAVFIGLGSVATQVLVPYAAHLAPEHARGRVVGNVTSGLLLGIMLARPVASLVADIGGWHAIFAISAGLMAILALVLFRLLPRRQPQPGVHYGQVLASMWTLLVTQPVLRRRAVYQAALFGVFSLFWTATPLLLAGPAFHMSQKGIALFALAGVAGAIAAPIAGRLADRGHSQFVTRIALALAAASFLLSRVGAEGSVLSLVALTASAILLDMGVSANLVIGQRAIFAISPEHRGRLNGLYMSIFFAGGATGSALAAWSYTHGGWPLAAWIGFALPTAALAYAFTEARH